MPTASLSSPSWPVLPAGSWGFSGSRSLSSPPSVLPALLSLAPASVGVGCARGLDYWVVSALPSAVVFRASCSRPWALVARSSALASAVAAAGGVLCCFPSGPCPSGVAPSRSFRGCGSGSWGTAALAWFLGARVFLFGVPSPSWGSWSAHPSLPGCLCSAPSTLF